jgi:hypothetical protein
MNKWIPIAVDVLTTGTASILGRPFEFKGPCDIRALASELGLSGGFGGGAEGL